MSTAAPPAWVKRLPAQVSTESIELAHALAVRHGGLGPDVLEAFDDGAGS